MKNEQTKITITFFQVTQEYTKAGNDYPMSFTSRRTTLIEKIAWCIGMRELCF